MILIPVYYGIRPSERLLGKLAGLGSAALNTLAEPILIETQDDPDRPADETLPSVKVVFAAYMVEMATSMSELHAVFENVSPTVAWFDAWWTCYRYVANDLSWRSLEEIAQPAQVMRALSVLDRVREGGASLRNPSSTVVAPESTDIQLTIAHPFGDIEVSLATWIDTGPGPRDMVRPIAARRRSTGEVLSLSVIPLQYRNDDESRRLIASGELIYPWKKQDR